MEIRIGFGKYDFYFMPLEWEIIPVNVNHEHVTGTHWLCFAWTTLSEEECKGCAYCNE